MKERIEYYPEYTVVTTAKIDGVPADVEEVMAIMEKFIKPSTYITRYGKAISNE